MGDNRHHEIRDTLDKYIEMQGWDDDTIISILADFIEERLLRITEPHVPNRPSWHCNDVAAFRDYLQHRADQENDAASGERCDVFFVSNGKEGIIQVSKSSDPNLLFINATDPENGRHTHRQIRFNLLRDTLLDLHDHLEKTGESSV